MLRNNRTKNYKSATNINNYNKFLICLDQNIKNHDFNNFNSTVNPNENEEKEDSSKTKTSIDIINKQIKERYKKSKHDTVFFSGIIPNENINNDSLNPNEYFDFKEKKYKNINLTLKIPEYIITPSISPNQPSNSQNQNQIKITENININAEINNIDDILQLIDTYKNDPCIKYNINMDALHKIKEPLIELNNMIGMKDLKINIVEQILYFVQDLHKNKNNMGDFMHTVIYGDPGTGKTERAKIMGKIYSKIGILNKEIFKKVTRSDLIAGYLGQTAIKTKDVIKDCLGGVLFIDEAYSLGNVEKKDSFSKECIDTLCEALSDYKEKLMVIIAGYETELNECFFNYNQGLDSRFVWRFKTDKYNPEDLLNIFIKKINDIGWSLEADSKINVEWFKKNMDYFKFYGRDIETLLSKTKIAHSKRVFCKNEEYKKKINLQDINKGLEMFIKNENVKNRKNKEEMNRLISTLYI